MKFDIPNLPALYRYELPIFEPDNKTIGERVRSGLENVLHLYSEFVPVHAKKTDNNIRNYQITSVLIVGSGAVSNRQDSDLDFLLLTPQLDPETIKNIGLFLSFCFFTDRPKTEAIDVYIRREDSYPSRSSVNITSQVKELLEKYKII